MRAVPCSSRCRSTSRQGGSAKPTRGRSGPRCRRRPRRGRGREAGVHRLANAVDLVAREPGDSIERETTNGDRQTKVDDLAAAVADLDPQRGRGATGSGLGTRIAAALPGVVAEVGTECARVVGSEARARRLRHLVERVAAANHRHVAPYGSRRVAHRPPAARAAPRCPADRRWPPLAALAGRPALPATGSRRPRCPADRLWPLLAMHQRLILRVATHTDVVEVGFHDAVPHNLAASQSAVNAPIDAPIDARIDARIDEPIDAPIDARTAPRSGPRSAGLRWPCTSD